MEFLSIVLQYKFRLLNVHAGISEIDIKEFILSVINELNNDKDDKAIIFFDEINTNEHVSG